LPPGRHKCIICFPENDAKKTSRDKNTMYHGGLKKRLYDIKVTTIRDYKYC